MKFFLFVFSLFFSFCVLYLFSDRHSTTFGIRNADVLHPEFGDTKNQSWCYCNPTRIFLSEVKDPPLSELGVVRFRHQDDSLQCTSIFNETISAVYDQEDWCCLL